VAERWIPQTIVTVVGYLSVYVRRLVATVTPLATGSSAQTRSGWVTIHSLTEARPSCRSGSSCAVRNTPHRQLLTQVFGHLILQSLFVNEETVNYPPIFERRVASGMAVDGPVVRCEPNVDQKPVIHVPHSGVGERSLNPEVCARRNHLQSTNV